MQVNTRAHKINVKHFIENLEEYACLYVSQLAVDGIAPQLLLPSEIFTIHLGGGRDSEGIL